MDTTLRYARLYDGTLAADFYRAMGEIELRLAGPDEGRTQAAPEPGHLLALLASLREGTLSERQLETLQELREGVLALQSSVAPGSLRRHA